MVSFSLVHIDINMYFQLFWGCRSKCIHNILNSQNKYAQCKIPDTSKHPMRSKFLCENWKMYFCSGRNFFYRKNSHFFNWNYTKVSVFSESYASKAWQTSFQMNRVFATNPNFRIPISLQHNVVNFWYFKLKLFE